METKDWKAPVAIVVLVLILLTVTYVWTKTATDKAWELKIATAIPETTIVIKEQDVSVFTEEIAEKDALIKRVKSKVKDKEQMLGFYRAIIDSLETIVEGDITDWPTAILDTPVKAEARVNEEKIDLDLKLYSEFHFSDLSFKGTKVSIVPFKIQVPEKVIVHTMIKEARNWWERPVAAAFGATTGVLAAQEKWLPASIGFGATLIAVTIEL